MSHMAIDQDGVFVGIDVRDWAVVSIITDIRGSQETRSVLADDQTMRMSPGIGLWSTPYLETRSLAGGSRFKGLATE